MFEKMILLDKFIAYERLDGIEIDNMEIRLKSHKPLDKILFSSLLNDKVLIEETKINNGYRLKITIPLFKIFVFDDYLLFIGKLSLMCSKLNIEIESFGLIV
jgi:hypothetical protein